MSLALRRRSAPRRSRLRSRGLLAGAVALGLTLTACGGGGSNTASGSSSSSSAPVKIVVGDTANVPVGVYDRMANELGYFKDEGLDVSFIQNNDPSSGVQGLVGGSIQILASGSEAILAGQKGADVLFVGSTANGSIFNLITTSQITDLHQLEGKTVGSPSLQSIVLVAIKQLLQAKGVDVSKVKFVASGVSPKSVAALQANEIQAAAVSSPYNFIAEKAGFRQWGNTTSLGAQPVLSGVFVVQKSWAQAHRQQLEGFLRAIQRVTADIYDPSKTDQMTGLMHKFIDVDPAYLKDAIQDLIKHKNDKIPLSPLDTHIDQSVFKDTARAYEDVGVLPKGTDIDALAKKLIDPSFAADAYKKK